MTLNVRAAEAPETRVFDYRTLNALCEQLRKLVPKVAPPVHLFDIPPQVMRGLFSVAVLTRDNALHRCVISYRDASAIAAGRRLLAKLLLWGELGQTEGRIEVGANTGTFLRYFLPNGSARGRLDPRRPERCYVDWLSAGEKVEGAKRVWLAHGSEGGEIGGISTAGVHYLVRLSADPMARLRAACRRLGCQAVEGVTKESPLFQDVMGEWKTR